ncbi:M1 family metallopeptidase [Luteimonas sp. 8-5]|uniref:M1 family metallopeptidase n=1 Tax=Luteimonas sp. 8-5 TaxID=3039387 RepID=UPI0024370BC7|nr:M1 family metallopeptidase [Luteimonas sp. 8-5]MDG6347650.1 M1 family metallopeptidase [Luteimonas sp. 8-5]
MRQALLLLSTVAALAAAGCARESAPADNATATTAAATEAAVTVDPAHDEFSYAEPGKVRITDLSLDLAIDFGAKQIAGTATYTLDWIDPQADALVLDTRDLAIEKVEAAGKDGTYGALQYELADADALLGSKLTIQVPERNTTVRIAYRTSPDASGLQWLAPSMTEGKHQPFMFSQSQQIHARSWVPLQDTTQVRFTYSAHVTAPKNAMVLMSADNEPKAERDGDYSFSMPQAIPSYLLAIAAGDLVFEPISERSGVWAEPVMVKKAAEEFADTEKMIQTAEQLYGPYRWGRYDILVLPPSFPYGGMENPRLTFATPTVIVGDKSLVSLVAHELAHSWSGNLVTFSTSRDAWLNEGLTSYVENRLVEALYGKDQAAMESAIAREELKQEFTDANKALQPLSVKPGDLDDPDHNLTGTVYTKGAWFMEALEQRFGREAFDAFLRGYFDHFAFQSIDTTQFRDYAIANLLEKHPGTMSQEEFDAWLYEPGVPASAPQVRSQRFAVVDAARIAWTGSAELPSRQVTGNWSTQEWVRFLEGMPDTLTTEQMAALDAAYHFTGTPNGEIAQRWYPLAARSGYHAADGEMAAFMQRVGRRKLIMPIYNALVQTPEGLVFAKGVFERAEPGYHPITTGSVKAAIARGEEAQAKAKAQ